MATDTKPTAKEADSPQVEALKFKRKQLVEKKERVSKLPDNSNHEHDAAIDRCNRGIQEIDAELKGAK